ncbi:MAG: tetratricopeptide repeat protein [Caulobacterales bacterium]|nr:tetratricopeptide repeat protein [Caulobacterales bacterium]
MAASLKELTDKANALKAAGRMADAIAAHRQIVALAPGNGVVLHNLAAALGDAGQNREAVDIAKRALATGLNAPETWLVLARSLVAVDLMAEAEDAFRKVLSLRPTDTVAHREFAQLIWMRTGDVSKALAPVTQALTKLPNDLNLALVRAHILGQCGNPEAEYIEVADVLRRSGGAAQLQVPATNAAIAAGKFEAALDHARAGLKAFPSAPFVRQAYARALLAVGEAKEAAEIAGALQAQFPRDQLYIALLATAWRLLSDERYRQLYDYDTFVVPGELAAPKGWASREAYLDDLIEALDRHHQYETHPFSQSVRHGSQLPSITKIDEPALRAYPEAAAGPIMRYIEKAGRGPDPLRSRNRGRFEVITAWSVRLPSSGFHVDHVHSEGWLSSACHLRIPETDGPDPRAGWLKFGEPGIPTTPKLLPEHFVKPQKGVLVVFPSYMWHGTVPFSGKDTRLTVAIDISPGKE